MKLFLQFILDHRYKELVQVELDLLGISVAIIQLESEDLPLSPDIKYDVLKRALENYDLEMSHTRQSVLVSKMRRIIADSVRENVTGPPFIKYSSFLSEKLGHSYSYLSTLFRKAHCTTLERHIIAQRIEVVKQMLVKEDLGLSEIAWRLGYCSVAHLCNQFKKVTGTTPTGFKAMVRAGATSHGVLCESCWQSMRGVLNKAEEASPASLNSDADCKHRAASRAKVGLKHAPGLKGGEASNF